MKNWVSGLLAIILGLIVIIFPLLTADIVSIFAGFAVLMIAIWLFIVGILDIEINKTASVLNIILGVLALILGIGLLVNPLIFSFLVGVTLYLAGFFMIASGLVALMDGMKRKYAWAGVLGIILGIIYIILGIYAFNPVNLGILIGLWLIITGIFKIFEIE
ncbi:MAG: DUF308 domain-containing protein [Methanobacterium sp.]